MNEDYLTLVDYSPKALALLIDYEGAITEELTDIGGKFNSRLKCGPGWIFSRKKSEELLINLLSNYEIRYIVAKLEDVIKEQPTSRNQDKNELPDYFLTDNERKDYFKTFDNPEHHYKYNLIVVRLTNGECVPINKTNLKTEFWIPDEGHDDEIDWVHNHKEEHFINESCSEYNRQLSALKGENLIYAWLMGGSKINNSWIVDRSRINPESVNAVEFLDWDARIMHNEGRYNIISEEDKQRLIVGYEWAIKATEKRCHTWLKRYGPEKLSINTYWANR